MALPCIGGHLANTVFLFTISGFSKKLPSPFGRGGACLLPVVPFCTYPPPLLISGSLSLKLHIMSRKRITFRRSPPCFPQRRLQGRVFAVVQRRSSARYSSLWLHDIVANPKQELPETQQKKLPMFPLGT